MKHWVFRLLRLLNWGLVIVTMTAYLAPFVSPSEFWPLMLAGLLFPVFLVLNISFIIFWMVFRKWNFLISLFCILLGWGHIQSIYGFNFTASIEQAEESVHVLSYNVRRFGGNSKSYKKNISKLLEKNWDVVCLQETGTTIHQITRLKKHLVDLKKFKEIFPMPEKAGVILSRHPIEKTGILDIGKTGNFCGYADIKINKKTIRFYNLHLESTSISPYTEAMEQGKELEETPQEQAKSITKQLRDAGIKRAHQVDKIIKHIKKSPHPVVLCGDLNDTPFSYTYNQLSTLLQDGFHEKGRGLGSTYAGIIPALRIDYILTSPDFKTLSYETGAETFSDHYPVEARVTLK